MIIHDILVYGVLIYVFMSFSNSSHVKKLLLVLFLSIISVYIEYDVFLKKETNIDNYNTILYLIIDYIHVVVFLSIYFLLSITIKLKCNINYLFILNIFAIGSILCFFYFKQCVLSLFMYNIINVKKWVSPLDRIKYVIGLDKTYNIEYRTADNNEMYGWINGQYLFFGILLLLNIFCFTKLKKIKLY